MATYYDVLGIDESASVEDIKRAYRRMALEHHPDRLALPGLQLRRALPSHACSQAGRGRVYILAHS
jgi:curved DNA-binding protein CbpA